MKTVIHLLNTNSEGYNHIRFRTFITWCEAYGRTPARMQLLLSSQKVYDWFSNEYRKLELQFLEKVNPKYHVGEIREYYADVTNKILMLYPAPFVKQAKKIKLETTNYN